MSAIVLEEPEELGEPVIVHPVASFGCLAVVLAVLMLAHCL